MVHFEPPRRGGLRFLFSWQAGGKGLPGKQRPGRLSLEALRDPKIGWRGGRGGLTASEGLSGPPWDPGAGKKGLQNTCKIRIKRVPLSK